MLELLKLGNTLVILSQKTYLQVQQKNNKKGNEIMKKLKKGFTLVELVIVIAVIAVLAAVLIPTFSGIVNRAKITADTETAATLNTLATGTSNIEDFVNAVEEDPALDAKSLIPQVGGHKFIYSVKNNTSKVLYVDGNFNPIPEADKEYDFTGAELWTVVLTPGHIMQNPKLAVNYFLAQDSRDNFTINSLSSFVTGDHTLSGNLTVNSETAGEAIIEGTFKGQVTINAKNAEIVQNGIMSSLNVQAVKNNSLELNGHVGALTLNKGRVEIKDTAYVSKLTIADNAAIVANNGIIENMVEADGVDLAAANFTTNTGTVLSSSLTNFDAADLKNDFTVSISDLAGLESFRDAVNNGATYKGVMVTLTDNIALNDGWTPIGNFTRDTENNYSAGFMGTFDGGNYTISNLNTIGYTAPSTVLFSNKSTISNKKEFAYGLFGRVEGAIIQNLNIENVKIDLTNQTTAYGDSVAAVVGFAKGVTLYNVNVGTSTTGNEIKAYDAVAGLVGRNYAGEINVNSCINSAAIYGGEKVGGIVGVISSGAYEGLIENCTNNGAVTVNAEGKANKAAYAAGIVGLHNNNVTLTVNGCTSNGDITVTSVANSGVALNQHLADAQVVTLKAAKLTISSPVGDPQITVPSAE